MSKKEKYTFEQWCLDNNHQDILDLWDFDKTGFSPSNITYASAKPIYLKCPKGLHDSEKKIPYRLTSKTDQKKFRCKECFKEYPIIDDISEKVYGELTVLKPDFNLSKLHNSSTYWLCKCSCGEIVSVCGSSLKGGKQVTCGNRKIHKSGENNSNWKGGKTPKLLCERTSQEYEEWRDAVYKNDWYTCQCCGKSKGIEKNAHHIRNFSEYDDLKYDVNNGILLCAECHHIKYQGSFHNIYGTHNNTPEQLEEYINNKRKQLGIDVPFSIDEYINNKILNGKQNTWAFNTEKQCGKYIHIKYIHQ